MNQTMRKIFFPALTGWIGGMLSIGVMMSVFWFFTWMLHVFSNVNSAFFIITELFFMGLAGLSVMLGSEWLCREKLSCKGRHFFLSLVLGMAAALLLLFFVIRKGWLDYGTDGTAPVAMWFFTAVLSAGLTGYLFLRRWVERLQMKKTNASGRRYGRTLLMYVPLYALVWIVLAVAAFSMLALHSQGIL